MKKQGHYCKVCGEHKANERFTGRGHATHICKVCAKLPPEEQAIEATLTRLYKISPGSCLRSSGTGWKTDGETNAQKFALLPRNSMNCALDSEYKETIAVLCTLFLSYCSSRNTNQALSASQIIHDFEIKLSTLHNIFEAE